MNGICQHKKSIKNMMRQDDSTRKSQSNKFNLQVKNKKIELQKKDKRIL